MASRDKQEHCLHLSQVLGRQRQHRLVINAKKCTFGAAAITFLGHHVSSDGATPLHTHMAAVQEFPPPTTVKELQQFLGFSTSTEDSYLTLLPLSGC